MFEYSEMDPYSIFIFAMNAPQTREKYIGRLAKFFDFIGLTEGTMEERCTFFTEHGKNDFKWTLNNILRFLQIQKQRVDAKEITGATLRNYIKTIKLFCEMNDILIPWKKITRGLPRGRKYADDRAPTIEEIHKIIEYPDRRIKAIVCTMASSGIRLGAWDYLEWGHIIPIERNSQIVAAKVIVYAGDEEEYFSFITSEAYGELKKWMEYRKGSGEDINNQSWVMRNIWDTKRGHLKGLITIPKELKSPGVKRLIEDAIWAQGIRKKLASGKRRHEFQADHGFRKWFKTRCEIAGMKSINIETLMGHSIGISDSYCRATEEELLQDYVKAAAHLTFNTELKLQKQVEELTEKTKDSDYMIKAKLQEKDKELHDFKERISKMENILVSIQPLLQQVKPEMISKLQVVEREK